jgi:hypothetical protein
MNVFCLTGFRQASNQWAVNLLLICNPRSEHIHLPFSALIVFCGSLATVIWGNYVLQNPVPWNASTSHSPAGIILTSGDDCGLEGGSTAKWLIAYWEGITFSTAGKKTKQNKTKK